MASTAPFRAVFDLEENEDRFFLSGAEKVSAARQVQGRQQRRRKLLVGLGIGIGSIGLVLLIILLAWSLSRRDLKYACPRTYDASKADLVFFVVGDWGRSGSPNQRRTARLMADVSACMPPQFVISTGDNFYPSGLSSAADPLFSDSFTNVYTAPGLQVPWYAVLGNHDYGDNADPSLLSSGQCLSAPASADECAGKCCISPYWQTTAELAARDPRWNATMGGVYTRTFPLRTNASASLDILFLDTNPIIYQYGTRPFANFLHGFNAQDGDRVKAQLQQQLNASAASGSAWRLVVGHHPVRSYGKHCTQVDAYDCNDMAFLRPWLERYRVAAYVNGHDHDQQLIKAADDPVHYVVSGAGSDTRAGEFDDLDAEVRSRDALFLSDTQGFLAVVVYGGTMRLHFYTSEESGPTYTRDVKMPAW